MDNIRVRFAPSPTGYLHIGGARTCLFNWLFAKRFGGKLILRIEDTDFERLKEDSVEQILTSLKWLGLDWDEGPYFQSQRLDIYLSEAKRLISEGKAYYCFCTPEELEKRREEARQRGEGFKYDGRCRNLSEQEKERLLKEGKKPVIRLKLPSEGQTVVNDIIRGQVIFENSLFDDMIIVKSNNVPTYNFACVIDDYGMKITHVIRAEEHLSNTPKQVLIYQALGYELPQFAHVPMILAPDRSKLSKRHGAISVEEFREMGFLAEAIINYLCLLGWSTENQEEIFDLSTAVEQFSLERISKNPAVYDIKKLTWINGHYLKTLNLDYITKLVVPFFRKIGISLEGHSEDKIKAVVDLVREKVWTLREIAEGAKYFFDDSFEYEEKGVKKYFSKPEVGKLLEGIIKRLNMLSSFDKVNIEKVYREYAEELSIKAADLIHPTRLALTGRTVSPGLFEVMEVLGREECIRRLNKAIGFIKKST